MEQRFFDMIEENPVVAAIKDDDGLDKVCRLADIRVVFILYGDICNIDSIVHRIQEAGKLAIVHVDLINGLSSKEIAVDFLHRHAKADGVISTKQTLIRRAKELGMYTVMRFFILDSMSLENIDKALRSVKPDFIEILPGIVARMISAVSERFHVQVIAGGLISSKEDIIHALDAGAIAVSSTNHEVWKM